MKYEICITLRPQCYKHDIYVQAKLMRSACAKIFSGVQYSGVMELTRESNIHAHLIAEFPDHKYRCKVMNRFRAHPYIGRHPASQIVDYPAYVSYMMKSLKEMRELNIDPILNDTFGVLGDINHMGFKEDAHLYNDELIRDDEGCVLNLDVF